MKNLLMIYYDGFPIYRTKLDGGPIPTPHLESLIKKSTFYSNVISAAPSTAMSLTSMFTGYYPHEFGRRSYALSDDSVGALPQGTTTLFSELENMGYSTHVIWDDVMVQKDQKMRINAWTGENTKFFTKKVISNPLLNKIERKIFKGYGRSWEADRVMSYVKTLKEPWAVFARFAREVGKDFKGASNEVSNNNWDDEIYDSDHSINLIFNQLPQNTRFIITSDHGRMYGEQGIWGYAFNLCEGSMKVFLVDYDPTSNTIKENNKLTSLINFKNIVLNRSLRKTKYIYADSAYADQWHRKTMIRKGHWKYIYHKDSWPCKDQLFDLRNDPHELINLASENWVDPYRDSRPKGDTRYNTFSPSVFNIDGKPTRDVLLRNDWDYVYAQLEELREERKRIWSLQGV